MELSADKQSAIVAVSGRLSAAELETLIGSLMELRARMLPVVPLKRPTPGEPQPESARVTVQPDPHMSVASLRSGEFRFWIRNEGAGWMLYDVPAGHAAGIARFILARTPDVDDGTPGLFGEEPDDGSPVH